ncbi:MAG: type II toxin-antitoxin system RelE/ParE family toxin [Verrucomicrobiales bacterium]|nr:type II toxin-antitoxin system RelE/ParE family toxin [Verrucomicrobiales bacterium]
MKLRLRPAFYADIEREELWLLERAGPEIADRWHEKLWHTLAFLQKNPLVGRVRKDLKFAGIRSWRVAEFDRWIIFYGVRDEVLVFYRVVSGTMNLSVMQLN